jgi:phage N-6-adenine-methyltransferase
MSPRNQTEIVDRKTSRQDWGTPLDLYSALYAEFEFTLDVCATDDNAKCGDYYTSEMNGLILPWRGRVWCNPPYGRDCALWIAKAATEYAKGNCEIIVLLVPTSTDTRWFHDSVLGKAELRFIKGRLRFEGAKYRAPFPSMLVIYRR